jgi:hypothetical protein
MVPIVKNGLCIANKRGLMDKNECVIGLHWTAKPDGEVGRFFGLRKADFVVGFLIKDYAKSTFIVVG